LILFLLHAPLPAQVQPSPTTPRPRKPTKFSFGFEKVAKGGQVRWELPENGTQEFVNDEYAILGGGVKIFYGDIIVTADRITANLKTNDIVAESNVVVDQGVRRLSGSKVIYNLDSETGTFFDATANFEPSINFTGKKIEKIGENTYLLFDGVFTSCNIDRPAWSFHLSSAEVTLDDYARMKNISFRAGGVPLFWAPYLVWPTKNDRSRGLLVPKVGASNRFGAYMGNAYFIPIGQSADTTIFVDTYSKGFYGTGINTRYVPTRNMSGRLNAQTVYDKERDVFEWKYEYKHTQDDLPGGFRGVIDVQDYSDLQFFRRFQDDSILTTISNVYSSAYLTKNRPNYSFNLRGDRREIFGLNNTSQVFEQLPSLEFRAYPNQVGRTPLYFSLESSTARLQTSSTGTSPALTTNGAAYFRTDFFPTLSLQLRTPPWISLKPQLSLRHTYYSSSLNETNPRLIEEESLSRSYAQGQLEAIGPSFSRIYNRELGTFSRFKHVIEPRIRYLYTSNVEDQQRVIRFDTVDSPLLPLVRDTIEYSLVQRIIGKDKSGDSAREIMSVTLKQTVSLSKPFVEPVGSTPRQSFTPVSLAIRANPYQSVTLDATASIGNISRQIDQATVSANVNARNSYVNLTWFSVFDLPGIKGSGSSQIRMATGSPVWKDKLRADMQLNFDANTGEFLEQRYLASFFASCYGIALEYKNLPDLRTSTGGGLRSNSEFGISISLKNVGSVPLPIGNLFTRQER